VEREGHGADEGDDQWGRTRRPRRGANPEEVLDAVFDFAEHLIAQQRIFAKQMLAAAAATRSSQPPRPPA